VLNAQLEYPIKSIKFLDLIKVSAVTRNNKYDLKIEAIRGRNAFYCRDIDTEYTIQRARFGNKF
jgi:hypothetical protein